MGQYNKRVWDPIDRGDYYDIPLTQGYFAKIDKEDLGKIIDRAWSVCIDKKKKKTMYASCRVGSHTNKSRTTKKMHRVVSNAPDLYVVDHINHDTLDNRKSNLRICTNKQNCENRKLDVRNKTGFVGVMKYGDRYVSQICNSYKIIYLGIYNTKEEASKAYKEAKKEYHSRVYSSF